MWKVLLFAFLLVISAVIFLIVGGIILATQPPPSQPSPPAIMATVTGKHTAVTSGGPGVPICSGKPPICIVAPAGKGTAHVLELRKDDDTPASAVVSSEIYNQAQTGMRFNITENTLVLPGHE